VVLDLDGVVLFRAELFVAVSLNFPVAGLVPVFWPHALVRLPGGSREWPRRFVLPLSIAPNKICLVFIFWCSQPGGRGRPWILARVRCRQFGLRAFPTRVPSLWSGACYRLDFYFHCKQGSRSRGRLLGLESYTPGFDVQSDFCLALARLSGPLSRRSAHFLPDFIF
jgi:hypothetical protein